MHLKSLAMDLVLLEARGWLRDIALAATLWRGSGGTGAACPDLACAALSCPLVTCGSCHCPSSSGGVRACALVLVGALGVIVVWCAAKWAALETIKPRAVAMVVAVSSLEARRVAQERLRNHAAGQ